jgi:hypothetical protein
MFQQDTVGGRTGPVIHVSGYQEIFDKPPLFNGQPISAVWITDKDIPYYRKGNQLAAKDGRSFKIEPEAHLSRR